MLNLIQLRDCLQKEEQQERSNQQPIPKHQNHKQQQMNNSSIQHHGRKEMEEVNDHVGEINSGRSPSTGKTPRLGRRMTIEEEQSGDYFRSISILLLNYYAFFASLVKQQKCINCRETAFGNMQMCMF
ncbi:unnamed protein product [Gongylonema pulchrum]|uniref:Uncharacterized protein n=1 Tax=Gongylonema pulchrum TaxID=637853 RepID=A0A183CUG8_9BILA|nr:unnamed protein product [Gongylonema pulchrum]